MSKVAALARHRHPIARVRRAEREAARDEARFQLAVLEAFDLDQEPPAPARDGQGVDAAVSRDRSAVLSRQSPGADLHGLRRDNGELTQSLHFEHHSPHALCSRIRAKFELFVAARVSFL